MNLDDYFKKAGLKLTVPFAPYITINPEKQPWAHQITGLNKLLTNDFFGLYDDPGTGKTMIAHAYGLYWVSEGQKVLCVLPPNLLYQFREELFDVFQGSDKYVSCHILDQAPKKRRDLYETWEKEGWPEFLCMSYQMFMREYEIVKDIYRVGVFDEAQALKNSGSKIFKLTDMWKRRTGGASATWMTGTPGHNEIIDFYSLIELTNPGQYESFDQFDRIHSHYQLIRFKTPKKLKNGRFMKGTKLRVGYKKLEKVNKALYKNGRRVLKSSVREVKAPLITEIPVKLETAHLTLYKKLVKERILELEDEWIIADNQQSLRQKCLQLVTCPELFVDDLKFANNLVKTCHTIIDGMDINETKLLIFCNRVESVKALNNHFEKWSPALFYGQSNNEKSRQKFLHDDDCRIAIANPKSAGAGYNFQSVCHTVLFVEPTGVPGDFKQAIHRVDRGVQKNLVNVYVLKAMGTIAPIATKEMLRKEGEAQKVYKDKKTFLSDFNIAA